MYFVDIHTHKAPTQEDVLSVVNFFSDKSEGISDVDYASIGLHPWHIEDGYAAQLDNVAYMSSHPHICAIGEAGLDKAIKTDIKLQENVFIEQAALAHKNAIPMIIHSVKTHYEIISLRKDFSESPPWLIHGFTGNLQTAEALLKNGFYISFGASLLENNSKARITLKDMPLNKIFLETDNSHCCIKEVYNAAAEIKEMSVESLREKVFANFKCIFKS